MYIFVDAMTVHKTRKRGTFGKPRNHFAVFIVMSAYLWKRGINLRTVLTCVAGYFNNCVLVMLVQMYISYDISIIYIA